MSAQLEAVKAKIRALMAKTVANGCTEGEALSAAAKAMELLQQHGLAAEDVEIGRADHTQIRSRRQPIDDLWAIVATVCRCRLVIEQGRGIGLRCVYVGRLPWPEVATWLQDNLTGAHQRALKAFMRSAAYQRRRKPATRANARRQFTAGFIEGVTRKLWLLVKDDWDAIRQEREAAGRAVANQFGKLRSVNRLSSPSNGTRDMGDWRLAGHRAGHDTNVRWGVQGGSAPALVGHDG